MDEDGRRDLFGEKQRMFFAVDVPVPRVLFPPAETALGLVRDGYSVLLADPHAMAGPQRAAYVLTNIVSCDPCTVFPADTADGVAEVLFRKKYAASPMPISDSLPWLEEAQATEEMNPSISRMLGLAAHQKLRMDP